MGPASARPSQAAVVTIGHSSTSIRSFTTRDGKMARTVRTSSQRLAESTQVCQLYDADVSIADIVRRVPLARSTISLIIDRRRADGRRPLLGRTRGPWHLRGRELARERQRRRRALLRQYDTALPNDGGLSARDRDIQKLQEALRLYLRDAFVRRCLLRWMAHPADIVGDGEFSAWTLDAIIPLLRGGPMLVRSKIRPTEGDVKQALQVVLAEWNFYVDSSEVWHIPRA